MHTGGIGMTRLNEKPFQTREAYVSIEGKQQGYNGLNPPFFFQQQRFDINTIINVNRITNIY